MLLLYCAAHCAARAPGLPAARVIGAMRTAALARHMARGIDAAAIEAASQLLRDNPARHSLAKLIREARRRAEAAR